MAATASAPLAGFDLACAVGAMADSAGHTPHPNRQQSRFAPAGASTPARLGFCTPKRKSPPQEDPEALTKFFRARSANLDSPIFDRCRDDSKYAQCEPEIRLGAEAKESAEVPPFFVPEIACEGAFSADGLNMPQTVDLHWRAARVPLAYAVRIAFDAKAKIKPERAYLKFDTTTATHMYMLVENEMIMLPSSSSEHEAASTDESPERECDSVPTDNISPTELNWKDEKDVQVDEDEFLLTFWAAPSLELRRGSATLMLTVVDSDSRAHEAEFTVLSKGIKPQLAITAPGAEADAQRTKTTVVFDEKRDYGEQSVCIYNETPHGAPVLVATYLEENPGGVFSIWNDDTSGENGIICTIAPNTSFSFNVSFTQPNTHKTPPRYYGYCVIRLAYFLPDRSHYDDKIPEYYDHVVFLEAPREHGSAIEASPDTPKFQRARNHVKSDIGGDYSDPASSAGRHASATSPMQPIQPVHLPMPLETEARVQFQFADSVQMSEDSMHGQALFESAPTTPAAPELEERDIAEVKSNFVVENSAPVDNEEDEEDEDENDVCQEFNSSKSADKWLGTDPFIPEHGSAFQLPGFSDHEPVEQQHPLSPNMDFSHWANDRRGEEIFTGDNSRLIPSNLYFADENTPKYMRDETTEIGKSRYQEFYVDNQSMSAYEAESSVQLEPVSAAFPQYETCEEDVEKRRESPNNIAESVITSSAKLRMPRGVRSRGVRISGSSAYGYLPLQNACTVPVTVRLGLRGVGCKKIAVVRTRYIEISPGGKTKVEISRLSAIGGSAAIHMSCSPVGMRGIEHEVAYKVNLKVEAAKQRTRPRRNVVVDRPTLSFYSQGEGGNVSDLRILNGTSSNVTVNAHVRDVSISCSTPSSRKRIHNPFRFATPETVEIPAGKVHVLRVRYSPKRVEFPAHYNGFIDVHSAGFRDTIPLFGYSGTARIKCSWRNGYIRAWNEGTRAGFIKMVGVPEQGAVLMPGEEISGQYPSQWRGTLCTGDEIERSRLRAAVRRGCVPRSELSAMSDVSMFDTEFKNEDVARDDEDLRWDNVCDISLHYAARLFMAGVVKFIKKDCGGFDESRHPSWLQWGARWNEHGNIHIFNGSPGVPLRFRVNGANPAYGTLPGLGDAVLTPIADEVEVLARGRKERLKR